MTTTEDAKSAADAPKPMTPKTEQPVPAENTSQLTPAQRKEKAKADKAARRAAVKEARNGPPPTDAMPAESLRAQQVDAAKMKGSSGQQSGPQSKAAAQNAEGAPIAARRRKPPTAEKPQAMVPYMFSHLPMARRARTTQASKDVHPAVLAVGQQMATFALRDCILRLEATLLSFKQVIEAYSTPKGNSLSRHFIPHVLNDQIEYLAECRPMCYAMGNAIRLLKAKVNSFDIDTPEDEAKGELLDLIEEFLSEKVTLAELLISRNAAKVIASRRADVVLTYGRHRLVEKTLLYARKSGRQFEVLILDDPYDQSGQHMAKSLVREGIPTSYLPSLGGQLTEAVTRASLVLLGAEAFFANGAMYAPSGTNGIALSAKKLGKPVVALCETIGFDGERVAVDALTYNEIDPDNIDSEGFRLMFDVTREDLITGVITENQSETDVLPSEAILSILARQDTTTQL